MLACAKCGCDYGITDHGLIVVQGDPDNPAKRHTWLHTLTPRGYNYANGVCADCHIQQLLAEQPQMDEPPF